MLNKNAYVGGDAYNYIINGTYAAAYFVLAAGFLISGIVCMAAGFLLIVIDENNKKIRMEDSSEPQEELPPLWLEEYDMGRYQNIVYLREKQWISGSPVMFNKGALLRDTSTGKNVLQLQFASVDKNNQGSHSKNWLPGLDKKMCGYIGTYF